MNRDDLFNKTVELISKVYDLEAKLTNKKTDDDVTSLQVNILKILYFSCSKNLSSLSECLNINLPNCSREVKKMTKLGYIEKKVSDIDKRRTELSLTPDGNYKVESFLLDMKNNFFKKSGDMTEDKINRCIESIDFLQKEIFNI